MSDFTFTNSTQNLPSATDLSTEFTITANPSTDIWSKLPSTTRFNAPILHKTGPLSSFQRARVHVSAPWTTLYDQGGLILVLNRPGVERKWIKTGIEFVDGKAFVSTVSKDRSADWSLVPIPEKGGKGGEKGESAGAGAGATIEMARRKDDETFWVYLVDGVDGKRMPVREVTWAFEEEEGECWVGVYVARPAGDEGLGELGVKFSRLDVEMV